MAEQNAQIPSETPLPSCPERAVGLSLPVPINARLDLLDGLVLHALREELGVTPTLRLEPYATLERSTFKAARIVDES